MPDVRTQLPASGHNRWRTGRVTAVSGERRPKEALAAETACAAPSLIKVSRRADQDQSASPPRGIRTTCVSLADTLVGPKPSPIRLLTRG